MDLQGRVAVITGGASGIGRALAEECAAADMSVVIADVDASAVREAEEHLAEGGGRVRSIVVDVCDPAQVEALADEAIAAFGAVHLVCLNAGVAAGGVSWELDERAWQWVLDVNLWGTIHGIRSFVPRLLEQDEGHVLVTSSSGGLLGSPGMAAYSASKHAVIGVAESLRGDLDLAGSRVGVTVLCPGFTRTRMNDSGRNWPDRLGVQPKDDLAPGHPKMREAFMANMDTAACPRDVARAALDAVRADQFWAVTDALVGGRLAQHLAPILSSSSQEDGSWKATHGGAGQR